MMTFPFLRSAWLAASAVVLLAPAIASAQAVYTFAPIANTSATGGYDDLGLAPNLNSAGLVAFTGQLANGRTSGVFTSYGGGNITTLATNASGGSFTGFTSFDTPRVNAAGTVVFRGAAADSGESGIYGNTGPGGAIATLVNNSGTFQDVFAPSLNAAGRVAFAGVSAANGQAGVFRLAPAVTTVGAAPADFSTLGTRVAMNAAGAVAFTVSRGGSTTGTNVLAGNGTTAPASVVSVGAVSGLASIDLGVAPHVSGDGQTVTFLGTRTTGSRGVFQFTLGGSALTSLVETGNGLFSDVSDFSITDGGRFAFLGTITPTLADADGTRGLFNGANPVLNRIVTEGDLLMVNGTPTSVASLGFAEGGLNENGQVAFYAGFSDANNTSAIFRADTPTVVPEPGSLLLLLGGGTAVGLALRLRYRSARS